MKKAFKRFIAFLGILMLILIIVLVFAGFWGMNYLKNQKNLDSACILNIKISEDISEKTIEISKAESIALGTHSNVSLREFLKLVNYAKTDPKIKAISIDGTSSISHSKSMELSRALKSFKESGKPVYAYGNYYNQGAYTVASISDSLFINPSGYTDLKGFAIIMPYLKDFLEKYHIDMEVFVAGKYKSYVEMYQLNKTSDHNRKQYDNYLQFILADLIGHISENRNIPISNLAKIIDRSLSYNASTAIEFNLIDQELYQTDYYDFLKERTEVEVENIISLSRYKSYYNFKNSKRKANVAYVVVEGNITTEGGDASANALRKSFKEIRKNDDIEHILIRINSPGGSAFASEEIWHEIELCKDAGKKVISSVSSISASGGYYLMCGSDKIFCSPSSLTGSIGVFIAFPVMKKALEENFSIHFDQIETGPFARRNTGFSNLNQEQKSQYKQITEDLYERFLGRVVEGRNLNKSIVDSIAQGKVYTGEEALGLKLVDSLIYLDEVFEYIKTTSELEEIVVQEYPIVKKELIPELESIMMAKMNGPKSINKLIQENSDYMNLFLMNGEPIARIPVYKFNN